MFHISTQSSVIILVLVALIIYAMGTRSCRFTCGVRPVEESYKRDATSYYDQGGWINGPPQINKNVIPPSTPTANLNLPPPSGLEQSTDGDLCQQCIGHCQIKIWAGVSKPADGMTEQKHCISECSLECGSLDI